jgi:HSP20 family protein
MVNNSLMPSRGNSLFGANDPFTSLHRRMNQLFDEVMSGSGFSGGGLNNIVNTSINVAENDKELVVTAELPGVAEQDIDLRLDDDVLTIRGEKKLEQSKGGEKENYHLVERSYGSFQRSVRLPYSVDPEQVQARFENGVLSISLPKSAQLERAHRIHIQAGDSAQSSPAASGRQTSGNGQAAQGGTGQQTNA